MQVLKQDFHPVGGALEFEARKGRKFVHILKNGRKEVSAKVPLSEWEKSTKDLESLFLEYAN